MAELSVILSLVDNMSGGLSKIASNTEHLSSQFGRITDGADTALGAAAAGASQLSEAVESCVGKTTELGSSVSKAVGASEKLAGTANKNVKAIGEQEKASTELARASEEEAAKAEKAAKAAQRKADKVTSSAIASRKACEGLRSAAIATGDFTEQTLAAVAAAQSEAVQMEKAAEAARKKSEQLASNADTMRKHVEWTKETSKATGSLGEEFEKTSKSTDILGEEFEKASKSTDSLGEEFEKASKSTDSLGEEIDKASRSSEKLSEEIDRVGKESEEASKKTEGFGEQSTNAFTSLSDIVVTAGLAMAVKRVAEALWECSKAAAAFEQSMAMVSTIADASVLSSGQISAQINQLSMDSAQSVTALAEAAYGAISASVDTANAVSFVEQANKLAVGGFTEQATAVDVLTTALNAYGLSADNTIKISDYLVTTQNLGKTTVDQLASSMGMVIPTAAAFNVELDNLSTAYAIMTSNGIATAQSTTYLKSMMSELADTGSGVAAVLLDMTGSSFSELMAKGYSLGDVMQVLGDSVDGNTTAFMNLWGSMEAGSGAVSLYNSGAEKYAEVLDKMQNSAGATEKAYKTMTDTTEYSTQRMENSFANLGIAIGDDLNPAVRAFQDAISDVVDGFTSLVRENPEISALLTGLATGFGTVATAIAGCTAVIKLARIAAAAFGTTIGAALGPVLAIAGAISVVTAAVVYFTGQADEAVDVNNRLVTSSQKMESELESLQAEHDKLVLAGERDTEAAYELTLQIDELSESFEKSKMTIGEAREKIESLGRAIEETHKVYEDAITANGRLAYSSTTLITQLGALSSKSSHTDAELQTMQGIVDSLNKSYQDLNLTLDETSGKINLSIDDLYKAVSDAANEANMKAATDGLVESLQEFGMAKKTLADTQKAFQDSENRYFDLINHPVLAYLGEGAEGNLSDALTKREEEWKAQLATAERAEIEYSNLLGTISMYLKTLGYSEEGTAEFIKRLEESGNAADNMASSLSGATDSSDKNADAQASYSEEVSKSLGAVNDEVTKLAEAYDNAYTSALSSIQGQFNLWDQAEKVVTKAPEDMKKALDSQAAYWGEYNSNLGKLQAKSIGIDGLDDVLAKIADGSKDSAAMLAGMSGMTDKELKAMVDQYTTLRDVQDRTAITTQNVLIDYGKEMDEISKKLSSTIKEFDMSTETEVAARNTMDAYVAEINRGAAKVGEAARSARTALYRALLGADVNVEEWNKKYGVTNTSSSSTNKAFANGTTNASDVFIAGEEGPELIIGQRGASVFPVSETNRIIDSITPKPFFVPPPASMTSLQETRSTSEKKITIEIAGSGKIEVDKDADEESMVRIVYEHIKPALMDVLKGEVFEEGDLSYGY